MRRTGLVGEPDEEANRTRRQTGRGGELHEEANRTRRQTEQGGEPDDGEGERAECELVKTNRWRRVPGEGEADVEATRSWEEVRFKSRS